MKVYTDYAIALPDAQRSLKKWFADESSYEEFLEEHPYPDPRLYLEEVGETAASLLEEGVWYLPAEAAMAIAAIRYLEGEEWILPGGFETEIKRIVADSAELLDEEPEAGELRLIYSSDEEEE
jgi:hypothetical protein